MSNVGPFPTKEGVEFRLIPDHQNYAITSDRTVWAWNAQKKKWKELKTRVLNDDPDAPRYVWLSGRGGYIEVNVDALLRRVFPGRG